MWKSIKNHKPPQNKVINTCILEEKENHKVSQEHTRNECNLILDGNLWWLSDRSMYVYYNPTHWKEV